MSEACVGRFVVAAPENAAARLTGILAVAGIVPERIFYEGERVLQEIEPEGTVLLTTYRLPDMTGEKLAQDLGDAAEVLMIVPQEYSTDELRDNVLVLRNPISQDALVQAVRTMVHCSARLTALRARADKLACTLEERKVIDRAKGRLMDTLHLSESEAHYRIQKQSMDSGRRIIDVAREILEGKENAAS